MTPLISNNSQPLVSHTGCGTKRRIEFDFPAVRIGVATYEEGPTGCTLFYFPKRANYVVDIRGGSPGTILLGNGETGDSLLDALCFTGGSVYGLEAITGVYRELFEERGFSVGWQELARVIGAVIYDYRPRSNAFHPDLALGRAAYRSAAPGMFPLGRVGAGASATCGKILGESRWEVAGQGAAFGDFGDVKLGVFTVVNPVGAIVNRSGEVVRGNLDRARGVRMHASAEIIGRGKFSEAAAAGNTTLTAVITNQKLNALSLRQLARQIHSSMSRAIQPFNTFKDGDVLVAVSTQEVEPARFNDVELAVIGSELAWDAVLSSFDSD